MKQKRRNYQTSDISKDLELQASTTSGGTRDMSKKVSAKETDCSSGVCSTTWKPDSLKR
ncbi:MAG: hypothetical protein K2X77_27825 [Candidatus Obscuribacterales bacterium]|jgi:hypothetical protein|nr:hypothetical protein [Candidatus Obscuribacterales bacterium]